MHVVTAQACWACAKAWWHPTGSLRTVWTGVAHGARLRQMERPVDIRQDVPWDAPQLTICKMCLLIMKVKKGKKKKKTQMALKTGSLETLNRTFTVTFLLSRWRVPLLNVHSLINLQSGRRAGHAEFTVSFFPPYFTYVISFHIILLCFAHSNYMVHTVALIDSRFRSIKLMSQGKKYAGGQYTNS